MITHGKLKTFEHQHFAEIPLLRQHHMSFALRAVISLRGAGDMGYDLKDTLPHRDILYRELGIEDRSVFTLSQGHTREVIYLTQENLPGEFAHRTADGWVTTCSRHIIGITAADCVPIMVYDQHGAAFGLVHSGWKGTGIIEKALHIFTHKLRLDPAGLDVCMGPAIGTCCYQVSRERAQAFAEKFGENTVTLRGGGYYLDLYQANINLCRRWGIKRLTLMDECTACDTRLGSYRRQGPSVFTRMIVLCGGFDIRQQGD